MHTTKHPFAAEKNRIIHVGGTDREIGAQHYEQVGEAARLGMQKFYFDFWKRALNVAPSGALRGMIMGVAKPLVDPWLVGRLVSRVPDFAKSRIQGIAEASGVPARDLFTVLVLPDLLPLLQAYLARARRDRFVAAAPPTFGCSSFVTSGDSFLHGRNLDFPGVGYWDRYPVIQVTRRKDALAYVGFTTAGVPIAGITGVNEAQISVSLHQHYGLETSLSGTLPFVIGEEILSRARSLDDALAILSKARVATSWAFIVADGKKKDAFIYECHPRKAGIVRLSRDRKVLAHSNFFQTPECKPSEYATTARMNWDNYWRKTRLEELVTNAGDALTPEMAAPFLGDHVDRHWDEEKIINRTVSQLYNIQSVVLDLGNMTALVAEGDPPIHLRDFREYDLGAMLSGKSGETGRVHPGYRFRDGNKLPAKESYVLSFIAAFDGDFGLAREHAKRSLELDFCPEAALVTAVLCLKQGEYREGLELLLAAKASVEAKAEALKRRFPPEYFEICLFLGRAHDLLGARTEAVRMYKFVASHSDLADSYLKRLAEAGKLYSASHLSRIMMPYSTYIPFA